LIIVNQAIPILKKMGETYLFRSKSLQDPLYAILFYFLGVVYILTMYFYFYKKNFRINHIGNKNKL